MRKSSASQRRGVKAQEFDIRSGKGQCRDSYFLRLHGTINIADIRPENPAGTPIVINVTKFSPRQGVRGTPNGGH